MMSLYTVGKSGVAYFNKPPQNLLNFVNELHEGHPPLLPAEQGTLVIGAGRTGFGLSRMSARAPGNEEALIAVVPSDIPTWHELITHNSNSRRLHPSVVFNPAGEKHVHILPPRDVNRHMRTLQGMALRDARWVPVLEWAKNQLKDDRVETVTDYCLASFQVQALTCRVSDFTKVIGPSYVGRFHPQGEYTLLHPSKSMEAAIYGSPHPLFGHEVAQAALKAGGRPDLAERVVDLAGYWVETTVSKSVPIRLHFAGTDGSAVEQAKRAIVGFNGHHPHVTGTMKVGRDSVFIAQYGGVAKNMIANWKALKAVEMALAIEGVPNYAELEKECSRDCTEVIRDYEDLAARAMLAEGITDVEVPVEFPAEVQEDIFECSQLNWPRFIAEATRLGVFEAKEAYKAGLRSALPEVMVASYREGLRQFVRTAPATQFGTTNSTVVMIYGFAKLLEKGGLVPSFRDVMDRSIPVPEGVRATPNFIKRFRPVGIPKRLTRRFRELRSLWT